MTVTTQRLLSELKSTLEQLPEDEQEARAASYLQDARRREEVETPERERYSFFKVLENANLPGAKDASVTYEEKLYGPQGGNRK